MKDYKGKKYLDHIFIERKSGVTKNGDPYEFQKVGIHIERFIEELRQVATNDKGFANFTLSSQMADPNKYTLCVDDWKPTNGAVNNGTISASPSNRVAPKQTGGYVSNGSSSDLPF